MSSYPSADDYAYALEPTRLGKHLRSDTPLLRAVSKGKVAIPKGSRYSHVASGFFAYIYRVKTAQGEYALRCPRMRFPGNSAERYQSLAHFLQVKRNVAYLVEANHFDDALYVSVGSQGNHFPVQVMGWVTGRTLIEVVAEKVSIGDAKGLTILAEMWEKLLISMKTDGIVHGDLHPDNVIVSPDNTLRLVDYDTLIVPGFSPEATSEGGMATYIHPGYARYKLPRPTVSYLDDFGALNILLSLRALSLDQTLRQTSDFLLFSTDDIESPNTSRVFVNLLHHSNSNIVQLSTAFFDECREPKETGKFRVECFIPVKPAALAWHQSAPVVVSHQQSSPGKSGHIPTQNGDHVNWKPLEDALPSSTGAVERRVHEPFAGDSTTPSSAGQNNRRTHPYKPE